MRVYLDACSLQRPLDDRSQPRINVEAEAVLTILRLVESGHLELFSSEALQFEIDRIPDSERQERANEMLKLASKSLELVDEIQSHARSLHRFGVKPLDALHLAFASWAKSDYFCTCDDILLKKARRLKSLHTTVVGPLELVEKVAP